MIELLNQIIHSSNFPILVAFLLGILMAISPCPLASNVAAIAYISKKIDNVRKVLLEGLFYTLGRIISYTTIAALIYFGFSSFKIANTFQTWGDRLLGPILIIIAGVMLGVIKININLGLKKIDKVKEYLSNKGYLGATLLGIILSLAFCPYSGVLFFAVLIPMILSSGEGLILAPIFAIGSGIPVIVFSFIIAFSFQKLNSSFNLVKKAEVIIRRALSTIFLAVGCYYSYFLIQFLISLI